MLVPGAAATVLDRVPSSGTERGIPNAAKRTAANSPKRVLRPLSARDTSANKNPYDCVPSYGGSFLPSDSHCTTCATCRLSSVMKPLPSHPQAKPGRPTLLHDDWQPIAARNGSDLLALRQPPGDSAAPRGRRSSLSRSTFSMYRSSLPEPEVRHPVIHILFALLPLADAVRLLRRPRVA